MKKTMLIIILSLVVLVLLTVAGLGIFLSTFNPNAYKDHISRAVEAATGRTLHFQNDLEVSFFPQLGLKTGRVTMTDTGIFGSEPFLEVENASLLLSIEALLSRVIKIEEISLSGLRLNLVTNSAGENNWEQGFSGEKRDKAGEPSLEAPASTPLPPPVRDAGQAPASGAFRSFSLKIRQITCGEATIHYRDMRNGRSYTALLNKFTLTNMEKGAELPVALSGSIRADNGSGQARFTLSALLQLPAPGRAAGAAIESFTLDGKGFAPEPFQLSAAASVSLERVPEKAVTISGLHGTVRILPEEGDQNGSGMETGFSGGQFRFTPAAASSPARLDGTIDFTYLDLDALRGGLLPATRTDSEQGVKGAPNLTRPKVSKPGLSRKLASDINELNAAKAESGTDKTAPVKEDTQSIRPIDGKLTITAKTLTINKLPLQGLRLEILSTQGKAEIPFTFSLYKGRVNGTARLRPEGQALSTGLSVQVKGLDMAEATTNLSGKYTITGRMDASAELSGKGSGSEELLHSLSGTLGVQVGQGEVRGFGLIPPDLQGLAAVPVNFPFEKMSASAKVAEGVATSRDILMQSQVLAARGGGKIHLAYGQVDLGIDFLLGGLPPAVPVNISGPYGALSYSVDTRTFLRNLAEDAVTLPQKSGKDLLRNIGGILLR